MSPCLCIHVIGSPDGLCAPCYQLFHLSWKYCSIVVTVWCREVVELQNTEKVVVPNRYLRCLGAKTYVVYRISKLTSL